MAYALPHVPRLHSYLWPVFVLSLATVFTLHPVLPLGWALGLVLGLLIPSFAELNTPWLRIVSNRIATYSYGIYVSHQFSIWIAFGLLESQSLWLRIPVLIGLLIGLPILLYHAIEKPMIDVGVRITTTSRVVRSQCQQPGRTIPPTSRFVLHGLDSALGPCDH
jgi:peptidoglycan/LPS O-acetylase OafA/YrhL